MSLQDIRGAAQCGRVTRDKITTQRIYSALPAGPESPRHMFESIFSSPKSETLVPEIRLFRQPQTQHKPLLRGFVWGEAGSQLLPCTIPHLIQGGAWIRRYPGIPSWGRLVWMPGRGRGMLRSSRCTSSPLEMGPSPVVECP